MDFIDEQGFRANVGIILTDGDGRVLIAGRRGRGGWQFPQGGIQPEETTEAAMFRELHEEVGLAHSDVEVVGSTEGWLRYRLPDRYIRREQTPLCIGQKQRWFLLQLTTDRSRVRFDLGPSPSSTVAVGSTIGGPSRKSSTSNGPSTCGRCTSSRRSPSRTTVRRRRPPGGRAAGNEL